MRHFYEKIQFYIKALLWFFLSVTIFLFTFIYVYYKTTNQMKNDTINKTLTYMERGAKEISDSFYRMHKSFSTILSLDGFKILSMLDDDGGLKHPDYFQLMDLQKRMGEVCSINDYITDVMLFFDSKSSFVVSPQYVLHDFKSSYENGEFLCGDLSYEEFLSLMKSFSNNYVSIKNFTKAYEIGGQLSTITNIPKGNKILYIYKYKLPYMSFDAYAIMFLDVNAMQKKLAASEHGFFAIANGANILTTTDLSIKLLDIKENTHYIEDNKMTYIKSSTGNIGLSFYTALSDNEVISQIKNFTIMLYVLLTTFVVLIITLAILSSRIFVKPLQNIFNRLSKPDINTSVIRGNAINHIYYEIENMSSNNIKINSKLSNWEPILKTNLLGRLLRGEILRNDEKEMIQSFFGVCQNKNMWNVAVIGKIDGNELDDSIGNTSQVSNALWHHIPEAIIYNVKSTYIAVLSKGEPDCDATLQKQWLFETTYRQVLDDINKSCGTVYAIGIGTSCSDIFDIYLSYREAERSFHEANIWKNPDVVIYKNIHESFFNYEVQYNDMEKLYNILLSGEPEKACELLKSIIENNFTAHVLNKQYYHICKQFYYEVLGVLMRISSQKDLSPVLGSLMDYDENISLSKMVDVFRQAFYFTAEAVKSCRDIPIRELFQDLLNFVKENYNNSSLSLKMLSQEFSLTEQYLSLCFKNETGINFSYYLENMRLTEAERQLLESKYPVHAIAQNVGYCNPNTFYKAFKRKHGIKPSTWLELQRNNAEIYRAAD